MSSFAVRLGTIAAVTLITTGMSGTFTAAAATAHHYQQRISLNCPAGCIGKFPKLPAGQYLDIDHVSCDVSGGGELVLAGIVLQPQGAFSQPLPILWKAKASALVNVYTLGGEVNIRVAPGQQAEIQLLINGSPAGECAITGTRTVINP